MPNLIPIEEINALQVFTQDGIDALLAQIKAEVEDFEPDVSTAKGRAEIKSRAYKVILSKGVIDRAGADLVSEWKEKAKVVDLSRRKSRKYLDELSVKVRQPYTDYEEETARMKAEIEHKLVILTAHSEALVEHEMWLREQELARKEAELKAEVEERQRLELERQEEEKEKQAKQQAEKEEKERAETIKAEAEAKAKREADEKIEAERKRAEKAELEKRNTEVIAERKAVEAKEKAEADKKKAVEDERLRVIREQEDRARISRDQAEEIRRAEEERKANADHRREINRGALEALTCLDAVLDDAAGKEIITAIYQDKIPGIRMVY